MVEGYARQTRRVASREELISRILDLRPSSDLNTYSRMPFSVYGVTIYRKNNEID